MRVFCQVARLVLTSLVRNVCVRRVGSVSFGGSDVLIELITDAGLTEFNGVSTRTCLAIGPDTPERLAPITDDPRLL